MATQECPYFKEFGSRCSFTGKQVTSLDNTLIMKYCYGRYLSCPKYQQWTRQEKEQAEARKAEKRRREGREGRPGGGLADELEKEIF